MDGGGDDPEAMIPAGVSGVMPQGQWQTASVGARGQGCVCRDGPQPPSTGSKSGDVVTGHLWKGWISQTDKQTYYSRRLNRSSPQSNLNQTESDRRYFASRCVGAVHRECGDVARRVSQAQRKSVVNRHRKAVLFRAFAGPRLRCRRDLLQRQACQ